MDLKIEHTLIHLFIIDAGLADTSGKWGGRLTFVSPEQTGGKEVSYVDEQGTLQDYAPTPVSAAGFEISGSNRLPTPKINFANVDGAMSDLSRDFDDLIGFKLIRIRTYSNFLYSIDGVTQSSYDPNAHFTPEVWYFNRKIDETKLGVTYELASVFEVEGMKLPGRRMYPNFCPFKYKGPECAYTGSQTSCPKTLQACQDRFGSLGQDLRFGGFPTAVNG